MLLGGGYTNKLTPPPMNGLPIGVGIALIGYPPDTSTLRAGLMGTLANPRYTPGSKIEGYPIWEEGTFNSELTKFTPDPDIPYCILTLNVEGGKKKKPRGNPSQYSCDDFKSGFAPFWSGIQQAVADHANDEHPIPASLLAAVAAQETGGSGASVPRNIQEQNNPKGFGIGPFQIDFTPPKALKKLYPGITPAQVFSPDALTQFPSLVKTFKTKGITPQQATDPIASAKLAASILKEGWNRYDDELSALGYYNGGPRGAKNPAKTTSQDWGGGDKKRYAESVKQHQGLIEDAISRCGVPVQ